MLRLLFYIKIIKSGCFRNYNISDQDIRMVKYEILRYDKRKTSNKNDVKTWCLERLAHPFDMDLIKTHYRFTHTCMYILISVYHRKVQVMSYSCILCLQCQADFVYELKKVIRIRVWCELSVNRLSRSRSRKLIIWLLTIKIN